MGTGGTLPSSHFEAFDEFFDFPYSNIFIGKGICAHDDDGDGEGCETNKTKVEKGVRTPKRESQKF